MPSVTKSIAAALITRPLHGLHAFAGIAAAFVWAAFLLNAALCPCDGADAAVVGDRSETVSQPVANTGLADCPGEAHSERSGRSPGPRCTHTVGATPQSIAAVPVLASGFSPWHWSAIDAPSYPVPGAATRSGNLAPSEIPPPQFRLYLRTLRLLI